MAVLLVSKLNDFFWGYFNPDEVFNILKINNFQGEFTDISV